MRKGAACESEGVVARCSNSEEKKVDPFWMLLECPVFYTFKCFLKSTVYRVEERNKINSVMESFPKKRLDLRIGILCCNEVFYAGCFT